MSVVSIENYRKQILNNSLDYDVENYESVLNKSVAEFSSYGVVEKEQLYATLAEFNIGLVKYVHAVNKLNKKNAEKEGMV